MNRRMYGIDLRDTNGALITSTNVYATGDDIAIEAARNELHDPLSDADYADISCEVGAGFFTRIYRLDRLEVTR